jgi:hypothetical protein
MENKFPFRFLHQQRKNIFIQITLHEKDNSDIDTGSCY